MAEKHQVTEVIPFQYEDHPVRALRDDQGNPWFIATDICKTLGLNNTKEAVRALDTDERNTVTFSDSIPGNPTRIVISESGLYSLIFRSNKPDAKKFRKWVTSEVLPSIRKTGGFQAQDTVVDGERPSGFSITGDPNERRPGYRFDTGPGFRAGDPYPEDADLMHIPPPFPEEPLMSTHDAALRTFCPTAESRSEDRSVRNNPQQDAWLYIRKWVYGWERKDTGSPRTYMEPPYPCRLMEQGMAWNFRLLYDAGRNIFKLVTGFPDRDVPDHWDGAPWDRANCVDSVAVAVYEQYQRLVDGDKREVVRTRNEAIRWLARHIDFLVSATRPDVAVHDSLCVVGIAEMIVLAMLSFEETKFCPIHNPFWTIGF